jgi:methyl-accepting chemotaxis protein
MKVNIRTKIIGVFLAVAGFSVADFWVNYFKLGPTLDFAVVLAGVIVAVAGGIYLSQSFSKSIGKVNSALKKMAAGDLGEKIDCRSSD